MDLILPFSINYWTYIGGISSVLFVILFVKRQSGRTLKGRLKNVLDKAHQIGTNRHVLSEMSLNLSSIITQNNVAISEVREATDSITTTLHESRSRFEKVRHISHQNIDSSKKREQELKRFIESIESLVAQTKEISNITFLLDGISRQTNILSFNASIEAARAGEAGKGFAVVADSVRDLAKRNMEATKQIKRIIEETSHKAEGIAQEAEESGKAVTDIIKHTRETNNLLQESIDILMNQEHGVQQIWEATNILERNISGGLVAAQLSSESSIRMAVDIYELQMAASHLKKISDHKSDSFNAYVEPKHVYHFNLTNNFIALKLLAESQGISIQLDNVFSLHSTREVSPAETFNKVYKLAKSFCEKFDISIDLKPIEDHAIKPIDVLCVSVLFMDRLKLFQQKTIPQHDLLVRYENWRQQKSDITPADVYQLFDYFETIVNQLKNT